MRNSWDKGKEEEKEKKEKREGVPVRKICVKI